MPKVCQITGKKASFGQTRSHALNARKRKFDINLVTKKVRVFDAKTGTYKMKKMRLAASALRTLDLKS